MKKDHSELYKRDIEEYTFMKFTDEVIEDGKVSEFDFKNLSDLQVHDEKKIERHIRNIRNNAEKESFLISPIIREYRGINKQVEDDRKIKISSEVDRQLIKVHNDATFRGYKEGVEKGKEEIFDQTRNSSEEKIAMLTSMISDVLKTREELMEKQRLDIYATIKNLTKWVILRELKDDGKYIMNLIEKLILEIHTKSDLLIHIDQKNFESMPDVLEILTDKLGELSNIRVEIDYDIEGPGIVLDSRNGIINGTLKEQFRSLDGLFSNLGLPFDDDFSLSDNMENIDLEKKLFKSDEDEELEDSKE